MFYIPINKNLIPYSFDIRLAGETFTFVVNYNAVEDLFAVDLFKGGEALAIGEKVVYGRPLFMAGADERFPDVAIIPFDMSQQVEKVGWEELQESVFLYIVNPEDVGVIV